MQESLKVFQSWLHCFHFPLINQENIQSQSTVCSTLPGISVYAIKYAKKRDIWVFDTVFQLLLQLKLSNVSCAKVLVLPDSAVHTIFRQDCTIRFLLNQITTSTDIQTEK